MITNYEINAPKPFARSREFQRYDQLDLNMFDIFDAFKQRYPRELRRLQLAVRSYLACVSSSSNANEQEHLNEYIQALQVCVELDRRSNLIPEPVATNLHHHADDLPRHVAANASANSVMVIPLHYIQSLKDKVECLDQAFEAGPGPASQRAVTDLSNFFRVHLEMFLKAATGEVRQVCAKGYIMMALNNIMSFHLVAQSTNGSNRQRGDFLR